MWVKATKTNSILNDPIALDKISDLIARLESDNPQQAELSTEDFIDEICEIIKATGRQPGVVRDESAEMATTKQKLEPIFKKVFIDGFNARCHYRQHLEAPKLIEDFWNDYWK